MKKSAQLSLLFSFTLSVILIFVLFAAFALDVLFSLSMMLCKNDDGSSAGIALILLNSKSTGFAFVGMDIMTQSLKSQIWQETTRVPLKHCISSS